MDCISFLERWAKSLNTNQKGFLGGAKDFTKTFLLCMQAFLLFVATNPGLLSTLKTFVESLKAIIDIQISAIELLILQLDIENQIINAVFQPYEALKAGVAGQLSILPLDQFDKCPPIKSLHDSFINGFGDYATGVPPLNKIKSINAWITRKEFELTHRKTYAQKLRAKVEQLRATEGMLDALIQTISCVTLGLGI